MNRPPTREPLLPAQVVLGVDLGTTAAKVVAFGIGSPWRHVAVREYPLLEPEPGHQVQNPETVVAACVSAMTECASAATGAEVVAVSLSTAMHGLIGLDRDLRPLTPLLTWADARASDMARELRTSDLGPLLHQTTGTPVHPMSPLTKLAWFARHDTTTAAAVRWWVGLKDYLIWSLTGTLATERSSASGTGLLDRRTGGWSALAVETAGISADQLPPVLPTTAILGLSKAMASRVGLPVTTPVVVGAADGPLGNLGTGALDPGVAGLSIGTSGAVRMVVDRQPEVLDPALFCYALTDDAWVVGGAVSNGGVVVRWAGSALVPDLRAEPDGLSADERVLALAEGVPAGSDGLVMLPYLLAERAPLWDPDVPGAYLGLRRSHTRAHLVRAAVEGVALQLGAVVDRMDAVNPGVPVTSVRATGGAFRSALWRDVVTAVLDRPLTVTGAADGSALGAAALGLNALGRAPGLGEALAMLLPAGAPSEEALRPDPALVEVYRRSRARVPELIDSLSAVAAVFRSPDA